MLRIFAFGKEFFKKPVYVIDALVILVAFVLEVVLDSLLGDIFGLLILLRLWRIVRLAYSVGIVREARLRQHILFEREKRKLMKNFFELAIENLLLLVGSERRRARRTIEQLRSALFLENTDTFLEKKNSLLAKSGV